MTILFRRGEPEDARGIAETIVEAFFDSFQPLSKSEEKLANVVEAGVQTDHFFVAVDEDTAEVVGTVGLADAASYPILAAPKTLKEQFGWLRGTIAKRFMEAEFYRPKAFAPRQAYLAYVGVNKHARGQGIAKRMLESALRESDYERYDLDVVAGNESVLPLYESIGFHEVAKVKEKFAWLQGYPFRYLMSYTPEGAEN